MGTESPTRPEKVSQAIKLLYGVLGISILRLVWTVVSHIDVRSPAMTILSSIMVYTVFIFLLYHLGRRKNWARIGIALIFAISIPLAIMPMFQSITHSVVVNGLGLIALVIYVVALLWLFQQDSSNWFRDL
jgi:hypothetical protein